MSVRITKECYMKKVIIVLAIVMGLSGVTLGAAGNNPNPLGFYITSGYQGSSTSAPGDALIAMGVDWNFTDNFYVFGELFGATFNPFTMGFLGGVDYEFLRQPIQEGSDFTWYVRGGLAAGGTNLGKNPETAGITTTATGAIGLTLDLENAGLLFAHFRPHLGIVITPQAQDKVDFRYSTAIAVGYRL